MDTNKLEFKRFTDKIRLLADEAWGIGKKELSKELHEIARKEERKRKLNDTV